MRRTCVGCRRVAGPGELVRLTRAPSGELLVGRGHPGRGAWVCSHACLTEAVARGSLARALKGPVSVWEDGGLPARPRLVRGQARMTEREEDVTLGKEDPGL